MKLEILQTNDRNNILMRRFNKIAKGMSYTYARSQTYVRSNSKPDVIKLLVRGTLDSLYGNRQFMERIPCPCCGSNQTTKWRLSARGRMKLKRMRHQRLTLAIVAQLAGNLVFISDLQDTLALKESIGTKQVQEFDSFFTACENGEYTAVWGIHGIIPVSTKIATRII